MSKSKKYTLSVGPGVSTAEINLQAYSDFTMKNQAGHPVSSITADQKNKTVVFTVEGGDYINAVVNCTSLFQPATKSGKSKPAKVETISQCNICFLLDTPSIEWQATGTKGQGDNPSMFPAGIKGHKTEHEQPIVHVQSITEANPKVPPSSAQVLNPTQVFLLDWNPSNKNIIVRGNSPLGTETNKGQTINFQNLQNAIVSACEAASGPTLSDLGDYVLHDIALLSSAEEYIWANEYLSFKGNLGVPNTNKRTWFPSTPTKLSGMNSNSPTGHMARWNVEPYPKGQEPSSLINLAKNLKKWMDAPNDVYNIYYVHCASGHDRTGMVSSTYLGLQSLTNKFDDLPVSEKINRAFIYGTTLQKQANSMAGNDIVPECYKLETENVSSEKSRCFMATSMYKNSFLAALNNLVPNKGGDYILGNDATRTPKNEKGYKDRPYVIPNYPFDNQGESEDSSLRESEKVLQ